MGNSLAVEGLIPEGFWRKGLKDTDPASEGALLILLSGLGGPANFATYDIPTVADWGAPKSGMWIAQHGCKIVTEVLQAARAKAGHGEFILLAQKSGVVRRILLTLWELPKSTRPHIMGIYLLLRFHT